MVGYAENAKEPEPHRFEQPGRRTERRLERLRLDLGGLGNLVSADYGAGLGQSNTVTGNDSVTAGGEFNVAKTPWSFIGGGCDDLAGTGKPPKTTCDKNGGGSLLGGHSNQTTGSFASVSGGQFNRASDLFASITGGCENVAGPGPPLNGTCACAAPRRCWVGFENAATGTESTVTGGENASRQRRLDPGGDGNSASSPAIGSAR